MTKPIDAQTWLDAKERRANDLRERHSDHPTILTVEALTPGTGKHTPTSHYLVGRYGMLVKRFAEPLPDFADDTLGPHRVFAYAGDAQKAKERAVRLEDSPLGRLIDIDVHRAGTSAPLSRDTLRKCLLCDRPAAVCRKEGTHSAQALQEAIASTIRQEDMALISRILRKAIDAELDLDPKFGLVTPKTAGSHADMTIELMRASKEAVVPFLSELFFLPLWETDMDALFQTARRIGLVAEQAMYRATHGINTHKGMIFNLGLAVLSAGYLVASGRPWGDFYDIVRAFSKPLNAELGADGSTAGQEIAKQYPRMGARAEAIGGFQSVQRAMTRYQDDDWATKMTVFVELVRTTEDTVLFKRAGSIENYTAVKKWFEDLDPRDVSAVQALSAKCVKAKLSFGGAADLFVVATFLRLIPVHFYQPMKTGGD